MKWSFYLNSLIHSNIINGKVIDLKNLKRCVVYGTCRNILVSKCLHVKILFKNKITIIIFYKANKSNIEIRIIQFI